MASHEAHERTGTAGRIGGGRGAARPGDRSADSETLRSYLAEIGSIPVLTAEAERELARRIRAAETRLRQLLAPVPYTGRSVERRWRELRAQGRVTGLLSSRHYADGGGDFSAEVDRSLGRVGRLLARRDRLAAAAAGRVAELRRIDAALARALRELRPPVTLLHEILDELRHYTRRLEARPGERARSTRARRRRIEAEVGLPAGALRALVRELEQARDAARASRDTFVRHNLRLVVQQAKAFRHMGVPFLDLIQEGNLGLLRAVEKFDERRGNRFSTYGVWWIQQACVRAIQNVSRTVRLPSHLHDRLRHYRRALQSWELRTGREPSAAELAHELGLPETDVQLLAQSDARSVGLDEPLPGTDGLRAMDRLVDDTASPADDALERVRRERVLGALLRGLEPRERQIVIWRYGLGPEPERTLQQIGDELGLSRERIRQIEKEALRKMRGTSALGMTDRKP